MYLQKKGTNSLNFSEQWLSGEKGVNNIYMLKDLNIKALLIAVTLALLIVVPIFMFGTRGPTAENQNTTE